ncbi:MAG: hypothetical protein EOP87_08610, partial [Verrucomicrobiaceae bacterium]
MELDEVIAELGKNSRKNEAAYGGSGQGGVELRRLQASIEPAKYFLEKWQDHMASKKAGNFRAAKMALSEIKQSGRDFSLLMPRSELLALYNDSTYSREQVIVMVAEIKNLDEIRPLIMKLQEVAANYDGNSYQPDEFLNPLSAMDKIFREYQEGLPVALELDYNNYQRFPREVSSKLIALRGELLKLVIPRYVGAPEGTRAKADESPVEFLDRLGKEAKIRNDVKAGTRIREASRILTRASNYSTADANALTALISGQNQEEAGQFELAVISYQQALKSGSDLVPAKLIGERLAAIKEEHPTAFEKGLERFLTPPPNPAFPKFERPAVEGKSTPSILIPPPAKEEREKAGEK